MHDICIPQEQLYLLLNRVRKVRIIDANDHFFEFLEAPPLELIPVYQALKIKWHKKFQHRSNL
ncbi:hypothetical protein DGG96_00965 [Legionella qingyii]|uniref:Uncharacterized protein n=1 Tax=Legionella qingyii TaxID=2184757 RepID=A0A317U9Y1_9GAMM|nr:hypothetical protein [Legionella qingyii]PWY57696.1 hypothetical protein DGG96_00965 [Legionella qingyii]RUR29228.1 hypothetical protein ELY16_00060 [Legionella qingyii]